MASEVEVQLTLPDAAGMVTAMSGANERLDRLVGVMSGFVGSLVDGGGRVNDDGTIAGVNAAALDVSEDSDEAFDIDSLREGVVNVRTLREDEALAEARAHRDVIGGEVGDILSAVRSADDKLDDLSRTVSTFLGGLAIGGGAVIADGMVVGVNSDAVPAAASDGGFGVEALREAGQPAQGVQVSSQTAGERLESSIDNMFDQLENAAGRVAVEDVEPTGAAYAEVEDALASDAESSDVKADAGASADIISAAEDAMESEIGAIESLSEAKGEEAKASTVVVASLAGLAGGIEESRNKLKDWLSDKAENYGIGDVDEHGVDTVRGKISGMRSELDGVFEALTGQRMKKTGLSETVDMFGSKLGLVSDKLGKLGGRFGGVARLLGRFASGIGVATSAMQIMSESIDRFQVLRDVSVSQTGRGDDLTLGLRETLQAQVAAFASGLSDREATAIQQGLIAGRVPFESERYSEGFSFAQSARLNYSMDVERATDLYVKAVVRGGQTVATLNAALENLADTAGKTGTTMTEMLDGFDKASKSLESKYGAYGTGVATEMISSLEGFDTETMGFAMNAMANLDISPGSYGLEWMNEYIRGGDTEAVAWLKASLKSMAEGFGGKEAQELVINPLADGYDSLFGYIEARDWDGLKEALWKVKDAPGQWGSWPTFVKQLRSIGFDVKANASPDEVAGSFERMYGGVDNAAQGHQLGNAGVEELNEKSGVNSMDIGKIISNPRNQFTAADEIEAIQSLDVRQKSDLARVEDFSEADDKTLNNLYRVLVENGIVSPEQAAYMDSDSLRDFLVETGNMYNELGGREKFSSEWDSLVGATAYGVVGADFSIDRFLQEHRGELGEAFSKYSSYYDANTTAREAEMIRIDLHLSLDGEAGEILLEQSRKAEWKTGLDNGID